MKPSTAAFTAITCLALANAASGVTVFNADFTGSDPAVVTSSLTTAANMDAGTSIGSWSNLQHTSGNSNQVNLVASDGPWETMNGNYWHLGSWWANSSTLTAQMDLSQTIALDGASLSMNYNLESSHTGNGGGQRFFGLNADGETLFNFYLQGGRNQINTLGTGGQTLSNTFGGTNDQGLNEGSTVTVAFGASNYSLTLAGDSPVNGGTITGEYFTPTIGDSNLVSILVTADGTRGRARFDNIVVDGIVIPEPSAMVLLGLGGLALLRRRR